MFRVQFLVSTYLKQFAKYQNCGVTRTLFKTVVAFSPVFQVFQRNSAQSHGAKDLKIQRIFPMALSNLRCTGRQELCCSQNVSAPPNAMKLF